MMGRGRHLRSLANLQPWKPGQSGNPRGRPKAPTFGEVARQLLFEPDTDDPTRTRADALAHVIVERAMAGNMTAIRIILDCEDDPADAQLGTWAADESRAEREARMEHELREALGLHWRSDATALPVPAVG